MASAEQEEKKSAVSNDDISKLILSIEQWKKSKRWGFITPETLGELMKNVEIQKDGNILQIIDVRHSDQDYLGGNINGSTNIDYRVFKQSLPNILQIYSIKQNFVLHCMYSQCRGLRCLREYKHYIEDIITNKYYQYLKNKNNNSDMIIKYKDSKSKEKSFKLTAEIVYNMMNQKIWVLKGGFNAWITYYYNMQSKQRLFYVANFEKSYWTVKDTQNGIELKHKNDW